MEREKFREEIFENLGISREVVLFVGKFGKCIVLFATGSCRKF